MPQRLILALKGRAPCRRPRAPNGAVPTVATHAPALSACSRRRASRAVSNSPISSTVVAGPASPATTTAQLPTAASVFSPVPVLVTVRDADGNLRTAGGDEVRIRTTGVEDIVATHNGDGTYSASFSPPGLGTISVEVLLNGNPIAGSPFSVTITLF